MDNSQAEREARLLAAGREKVLELVMKAEKKGKVGSLPYQNYLVRQVIEELAADIKRDSGLQNGAGAYKKFAQYLGSLEHKIVALRAIQAVLGVLFKEGAADYPAPVWKMAAGAAGRAVYREYLMRHFAKLSPALFNSLTREYRKSMTSDERHVIKAFKAKFKKEGFEYPVWRFGDIEQVGAYLLTRMQAHRFVESWSKTEVRKGKAHTVRYIQLSYELRTASMELMDLIADMPRVAGAMIEPPLPWDHTTNTGGGFHTTEMQRLSGYAVQGRGLGEVSALTTQTMNILQSVEYRINKPVLDAVRALSLRQNIGKQIIGADAGPKPEYSEDFTEKQKKAWKNQARIWFTEKKRRAVLHAKAQRTFREATELAAYPVIWFSYFADSRGRFYARAGEVSPQGTDLSKGLLEYAQGQPLVTPAAIRWFKIHGANKFGIDKVPLNEREQWVDENHQSILAMAADPLSHREWAEADTPVSFLAWVFEYAKWHSSVAERTVFRTRLPISQDGTCNGLQNLSALMCDSVGGAAVNLTPSNAPRDIYSDVAVRVTELLQAMPPSKLRDAWLKHGINRKVTKRTTMTVPYNVTRYASSEFINEDYLEKYEPPEFDKADYGDAANFISHVLWAALDDVVVKSREVMEWLKGWAKDAVQKGKPVRWTTPQGLYVNSDYERMTIVTVKSIAFGTRIKLSKPMDGTSDIRKTVNAIAPNFVHSLDAAHLSRVVNRAHAEGIQITAIHDDFGTYAEDTDRLHQILREEFVLMYEGNTLLADLAADTGYEVPPPSVGDLDLREILRSTYFFA